MLSFGFASLALALTPGPARTPSRRPTTRVGAVSMAAGGADGWESDLREGMAFLGREKVRNSATVHPATPSSSASPSSSRSN